MNSFLLYIFLFFFTCVSEEQYNLTCVSSEQYKVKNYIKANFYAFYDFQGDRSPERDEGSGTMCGDDALFSGVRIMPICK